MSEAAQPASSANVVADVIDNGQISAQQLLVVGLCLFFNMLDGFDTLERLASGRNLIVPGHDPLVTQVFPNDLASHIWRLDHGPDIDIPM